MITRKIRYSCFTVLSPIHIILGIATESLLLLLLLLLIKNMKGWSDGSAVESMCCSFTRAEFGSQCPCQVSYNLL